MKQFYLTFGAVAGLVFHGLALPPVQAQDAATQTPPAATLPGAKEVFQKHLNAIGDADAIAAVKNIVQKGKISMPAMGLNGTLEITQVKPDKMATKMELPQVGEQVQVFDGETGWMGSPVMGMQKMSDEQIAQTKAQMAVETMEGFRDTFKKARIVNKVEFDGAEAYEMETITKTDTKMSMFFNVETGLMSGMKMIVASPMGDVPTEVIIRDYKPSGPMKIPHTTLVKSGPVEMKMEIESVEIDTDIPAETFQRPDGI